MIHIKQVKNRSDKNNKINFYLTIAEHIKNNNKLPTFFSSNQQREYYLKPLRIDGIITKKGYGVWDINWSKFEIFYEKEVKKNSEKSDKKVKKNKNDEIIIRGHGYQFYVEIPNRLDWSKREQILKKSNLVYKPLDNGAFRIRVLGYKIWFTERGILVYFPEDRSYYNKDIDKCENLAIYDLLKVLRRIRKLIDLDFSFKGEFKFKIDKNHYAKIRDEIASKCNHDKLKIRCRLDGEEWFLIDDSLNLDEAETVSPKSAKQDMKNIVVPTFNSIKEYHEKYGYPAHLVQFQERIDALLTNQEQITSNQNIYAENQASHLSILNDLRKAVTDLTLEVKKFRKV